MPHTIEEAPRNEVPLYLFKPRDPMPTATNPLFDRTRRLLGDRAMQRLAGARVILFGVGGVGSWCAESLIRSGIGQLTLVDSDHVAPTNLNRQLMATTATVGQLKVEALRQRLLTINPQAHIEARPEVYSRDTAHTFALDDYDIVIDAIDSLSHKLELILHATAVIRQQKEQLWAAAGDTHRSQPVRTKTTFFSSMGSALKLDPTQLRVSEFWQVDGCPLARALRKRMKQQERFPATKFQCVWSPELHANLGTATADPHDMWSTSKAQINGTIAHITAIFGFTLAGLAVQHLIQDDKSTQPHSAQFK